MNLATTMLTNKTMQKKKQEIVKIPIQNIKSSKFNKMPIIEIDGLAESINQKGLQNPIHVRQINAQSFICIGGHRRIVASKKLGYQTIDAIIRYDIENDHQEKIAVAMNNAQREETKEVLQIKILEWAEIYDAEKKLGNIEVGMRKVDWIAQFTNCSRSTVQRYLKQYTTIDGNDIKQKKLKRKTADIVYLENKLSQFAGNKVFISNNSLTFKFDDIEQLNILLDKIGFDLNQ